jgi:hypothetical protein
MDRLSNTTSDNSLEVINLYSDLYNFLVESAETSKYQLDELENIVIHKKGSK